MKRVINKIARALLRATGEIEKENQAWQSLKSQAAGSEGAANWHRRDAVRLREALDTVRQEKDSEILKACAHMRNLLTGVGRENRRLRDLLRHYNIDVNTNPKLPPVTEDRRVILHGS